MVYGEEKRVSEFNSAIDELQGLSKDYNLCIRFREQGSFSACKEKLTTIQIKLNNDITFLDNADNNYVNELKRINNELEDAAKEKKRNKIYSLLIEKEILLRKVQEDAGKGSKWQDSEGSQLDL